MLRTTLGRSRVRESRTLGSVGAKPNGLATRPSPSRTFVDGILGDMAAYCAGNLVRMQSEGGTAI